MYVHRQGTVVTSTSIRRSHPEALLGLIFLLVVMTFSYCCLGLGVLSLLCHPESQTLSAKGTVIQ